MSRLSKMQVDHLTSRISIIISQLTEKEINSKLPPPPKPVTPLTENEMYQLISTGKANLKPREEVFGRYQSVYFYDAYNYPIQGAKIKIFNNAFKAWNAKAEAIRNRYAKEEQRMKDEAILGDSATAMRMLTALEKKLSA